MGSKFPQMFAKHAEILICCAISISFDSWRESIKCALHKQVEYHYVLTPILCPCLCLSLINRMTSTIYQLQYQRQRPQRGPNCAQYTWATLLAKGNHPPYLNNCHSFSTSNFSPNEYFPQWCTFTFPLLPLLECTFLHKKVIFLHDLQNTSCLVIESA